MLRAHACEYHATHAIKKYCDRTIREAHEREMKRAFANGIDISYEEEGTGFPLVLIHGLSDSSALWTSLLPDLAKYYGTVAFDIRGHGNSAKPDMSYSIQLFSEDLFDLMRTLAIPRAHLLGLSMGAAIAQQFTLDHPQEVRSLILLSAFSYCDCHVRRNLEKLQAATVKHGLSGFFDEAIRLVVTPEFLSANADDIALMRKECTKINSPTAIIRAIDACLNFNLSDQISRISHQALIVSGREDLMSPIDLAEQIHRSIKGSEWRIMEGVGHNLVVPEKVPELAKITLEFLKRH